MSAILPRRAVDREMVDLAHSRYIMRLIQGLLVLGAVCAYAVVVAAALLKGKS